MGSDVIWVRTRADDGWRALNAAGAVAMVAWMVLSIATEHWGWLVFVVLVFTNLVQRALSGVLVGRRWTVRLAPFAIPRWLEIVDVTTVEVVGNQRFAKVVLWAGGKRHAVFRVRVMNDYLSSRDLAVLLTPVLQARGSSAGLHDAAAGEWLIPPAGMGDNAPVRQRP